MDKIKVKKLPKECFDVFNSYKFTPYYINKSKSKFKSHLESGKASPKEINDYIYSKFQKKITSKKRYDFLKKENIGIDCSGFVSYILNAYSQKKINKNIYDIIKKTTLNPFRYFISYKFTPIKSKLNSETLTNNINTIKIDKINDIRPGDLIRMNGGAHIAIISEIEYKGKNVSKIKYWQSTEKKGVCESEIIIKNVKLPLKDQYWKDINGALYKPLYLFKKKINSNGIRRLKLLQ